ncbi:translocation protein SEC63 homolog [Petromyzon marinus]|uniref:translocation protein SEC63 homolog n=1 Tax=Petromyzon marinus TaxID=7757 RepID=UPI003F70DE39
MAGQQFEYDASGATFHFFLTACAALLVVPATCYLWPRDEHAERRRLDALSRVHRHSLWFRLKSARGGGSLKPRLTKLCLLLGWVVLISLVVKVFSLDRDYKEYNPYDVLGLEQGANVSDVRRQFHQLSLRSHPDKGGDPVAFMRIVKAYETLTDSQSKENWDKYGHPDGPQAMSFGIALPAWIVDQKNSMLVLAVYGLAFMVILPSVVGVWWYRSIRYSGEQILLSTTQLYAFFLSRNRCVNTKRVVMILGASCEFCRYHNKEAPMRPEDDVEVPQLIKELGGVAEGNREQPLCYPYSVKARALIHAHLSRITLPASTLEKDRQFVLCRCPALLQEMISISWQLIQAGRYRGMPDAVHLQTVETCMKLSQMLVQGLWESRSVFLQLPHVRDEHLRHFSSKKHTVRTLQDLVALPDTERRSLFRFLGESEAAPAASHGDSEAVPHGGGGGKYGDIMAVLASYPHVRLNAELRVLDDDDVNEITAGSLVTVTIHLSRNSLGDFFENSLASSASGFEDESKEEEVKPRPSQAKSAPKGGGGRGARRGGAKSRRRPGPAPNPPGPTANSAHNNPGHAPTAAAVGKKGAEDVDGEDAEEEEEGGGGRGGDEDQEWAELQQSIHKRERALMNSRSRYTHTVYTPSYPEEKQEWWWLYIMDKRRQSLVTPPLHVCTLRDSEELELRFPAPERPGVYSFAVVLRSDSYLGFDQVHPLKFEVHEARPHIHPQLDEDSDGDSGDSADDDSGDSADSGDSGDTDTDN